MDDFGDILYIAFMILAAIIGAVRSGKKKRKVTTMPEDVYPDTEEQEEAQTKPVFGNVFEKLEQAFAEEQNEERYKEPEKPAQEPEIILGSETDNPYNSINESFKAGRNAEMDTEFGKDARVRRKTVAEHVKEREDAEHLQDLKDEVRDQEHINNLSIQEMLQNQGEVKKAIILSEILNRKY